LHRDHGVALDLVDGRVDGELGAAGHPVGGVAPGEDARGAEAVSAVPVTRPRHHEVPVSVHRHRRLKAEDRRPVVHLELAPRRGPVGVELPRTDGDRPALVIPPGDDEIPVGVHRDGRLDLVARGGGVDAELVAHGRPVGGVALGVNAFRPRVLAAALPDDDEVAVGIDRDRRLDLVSGGIRVDAELVALRGAGGVEPAGEDPVAARVRADPGDDEVPVGVGRRRGLLLGAGYGLVDSELRPDRRERQQQAGLEGLHVRQRVPRSPCGSGLQRLGQREARSCRTSRS
jgi:hypothetical protein